MGFAFLLGAVAGSFLNVVAYRLPRRESLVRPRSHCPTCNARIAAYDNVPIVSWLVLRGRCRRCNGRIAVRYLVVEVSTAMLFAAVVAVGGVHPQLLLALPFVALMIAVAAIDLEHRIVPNRLLAVAAIWGLAASLLVETERVPGLLLAGLAAGGLLLIAALVYPAGMGMGDVKLAAVMGLYLGKSVALALIIGFAVGAAVGIAIILREGRTARKKALPLAPFLAVGGVAAQLVGPELIQWYTSSFFS